MKFRKLLEEFLRYQAAGSAIAIMEGVSLFLLTDGLQLHYLLSNLLCFLLTTLLNYVFGVIFVFKVCKNRNTAKKLTIWLALSLLRLGFCQTILWLGTEVLGLYYMVSKVLSMVFSHFYNFFGQRILLQKN